MPTFATLRKEKKLIRTGLRLIVGLDEAGRGSWAGPIVAAAVILDPKIKIKGVADSKKLRAPIRKKVFQEITGKCQDWATGIVQPDQIDKIGIWQANILAVKLALKNLTLKPDYFLADAFDFGIDDIKGEAIIRGDEKIKSIAAASIIAKVVRDEIMDNLDEQFPQYGFKQHKGYGTNHHFEMLVKHGPSKIHRYSFEPIKNLAKG